MQPLDDLVIAIDHLDERSVRPGRMLHPLLALEGAIERMRDAVPSGRSALDDRGRELLLLATTDLLRAIVHARRWSRELEAQGVAVLDRAAAAIGADTLSRLGYTGRLA